jgi:hypothetical protein
LDKLLKKISTQSRKSQKSKEKRAFSLKTSSSSLTYGKNLFDFGRFFSGIDGAGGACYHTAYHKVEDKADEIVHALPDRDTGPAAAFGAGPLNCKTAGEPIGGPRVTAGLVMLILAAL